MPSFWNLLKTSLGGGVEEEENKFQRLSGSWEGCFNSKNSSERTIWSDTSLTFERISGSKFIVSGGGVSIYSSETSKAEISEPFLITGEVVTNSDDSKMRIKLHKAHTGNYKSKLKLKGFLDCQSEIITLEAVPFTGSDHLRCCGSITLSKVGESGELGSSQSCAVTPPDIKSHSVHGCESVGEYSCIDLGASIPYRASSRVRQEQSGISSTSPSEKTTKRNVATTPEDTSAAMESFEACIDDREDPFAHASVSSSIVADSFVSSYTVANSVTTPSRSASWSDVRASCEFQVRQQNYRKIGKAFSEDAMYSTYSLDCFRAEGKPGFITPYAKFPTLEEIDENVREAMQDIVDLPHFIVQTVYCPCYEPPNPIWGGGKIDGDGLIFVMVFQINLETIQRLRRIQEGECNPNLNAVNLLKRWVADANKSKDEAELDDRMKFICKLCNIDDIPGPVLMKKTLEAWNAKPVLGRPQLEHANFTKHDGTIRVMEVVLDIHRFRFFALKIIHSYLPKLPNCAFNFAILVEGRNDEEQPEQILGSFALQYFDSNAAPALPDLPNIC